jgi:membrane protein DedA with SNARE-associated domain
MFEAYVDPLIQFIRAHEDLAPLFVGALAFMESLAFLSLLVPAWGVLVACGALVSVGALPFWPIVVGGAVGAALGDWLSYWIGWRYKDRVHHMWPLSKYPAMLEKGEAFFRRWGAPGVVIARFSGPLRATVPLMAGIFEMPAWRFQIANVVSAFAWAAALIYSGAAGLDMVQALRGALGW